MKEKIIISPTNSKAIELLKVVKDKKAQIQKHFAQPGSKLTSLKVKFNANTGKWFAGFKILFLLISRRIRNTILNIINQFFEDKGIDKVLLFYCDDDDGKKIKRSNCFDLWFDMAETITCFKKYDEEIIIKDEAGLVVDTEFLSLIIECNNPKIELILNEFQSLKEQLISDK